jgi:long-chain acyl-CoA synthetase
MAENNFIQMFLKWERENPDRIFLRQPVNGQWKTWTYRQAGDEIRRIVAGLGKLNLQPKSTVAILSKNCAHWIMADLAIIMAGFISVPLYANSSPTSIRQLLEHSECEAIFIGKLDDLQRQRNAVPTGVKKIGIDYYGTTDEFTWSDWLAVNDPIKEIAPRNNNELLTIMYTSGTTGTPKGAMFNLKAFDYVTKILLDYLDKYAKLPPHPRLFSYLPLCHIAEKNLTEMLALYTGASISFVESLETFPRDLSAVQPDLFFGVPRIWAKFQEKILEKIPQKKLSLLLRIPLLNSILKSKIKRNLGLANAKLNGTGAAPMPASLLEWYHELGITIREIYGMTENCALSHANQDQLRFGTVGKPLEEVEVRYTESGEILVKHDAMMLGYFKEPALTTAIFSPDGFMKTGDLATVDADGFVTITGRVKDQFKTDKAKYISPTPIELKLAACPDIEQVCVVGSGLPQPIALAVLSAIGKTKSKEQLSVIFSELLESVNNTIEHYEALKKVVVMKDAWLVENGFMTPSLKIKRVEVEKAHAPKYAEWYRKNEVVLWES